MTTDDMSQKDLFRAWLKARRDEIDDLTWEQYLETCTLPTDAVELER